MSKTENSGRVCGNRFGWNSSRGFPKLMKMNQLSVGKNTLKHVCWKKCSSYARLEEEFSAIHSQGFSEHGEPDLVEDSPDRHSPKPLSSEEVKVEIAILL